MLAVVIDWTFTSGSVDLRASLFTDRRRVIYFFACLIFAVGLDREIILTAKFSRSMSYFEAPKERRKTKGLTSCSYPVTRHGIVANWS